jgi:predicted TIM-barrel enzyme
MRVAHAAVYKDVLYLAGGSSRYEVGVDNIIVHFGNSSGGTIGLKTVLAEDAARKRAGAVLDALSGKFSDRVVTCHGGAIETSADFERFLKT